MIIAAAGGAIVYYQYVAPPSTRCGVNPVHRLIFMTAIIKEIRGFNIYNAAILNQTSSPSFSTTSGANLTGVSYRNYKTDDNATIFGNLGDTITLYIKSIDANDTRQVSSATGHGFNIEASLTIVNGTMPNDDIRFGAWYSVTVQVSKQVSGVYRCTQFCSNQHPSMTGQFVAGCGS